MMDYHANRRVGMRKIMATVPGLVLCVGILVCAITDRFAMDAKIVNGSEGVIHDAWRKSNEAIDNR